MKIDDINTPIYQLNPNNHGKDSITEKSNFDLDKNTFLHLLTTQLANQDPLNPMDDREFIAQLAQFSSLEQMNNMNDKMDSLIDSIGLLNWNQVEADVSLYQLLENIAKHLGVDLEEKPEKPEKPEEPGEEDKPIEVEDPRHSLDREEELLKYKMLSYKLNR